MKKILSLILACVLTVGSTSALTASAADNSNYAALDKYSSNSTATTTKNTTVTTTVSKDLSFTLSSATTYPGEPIIITVTGAPSSKSISVSSTIDFKPNFFESSPGVYTALFPVNYRTAIGQYPITVTAGEQTKTQTLSVQDKKFQIQNMEVDTSIASSTIESDKANVEFENNIARLRPVASSQKYFQNNNFVWPVGKDARVTTEFGMIRYVNGKATASRHGAIDFAVPKGTNVKATNDGKVLYSGFLLLTGNTVVIEHGYGLKSWYYHMDSLSVKTDDVISAGTLVGTVGSTGFSTGPHLHFGMSVNNVFVNPKTIIDDKILDNIK